MRPSASRPEVHLSHRSNWLRAAVLGANDGIEPRGLPPALAGEVALTRSRRGALQAHLRDELGLDERRLARPFQAAWASAVSFSAGAALPLLAVALTPASARVAVTAT